MDSHLAKGRVVDTFVAKGLRVPDSLKETDSLGKYSKRYRFFVVNT